MKKIYKSQVLKISLLLLFGFIIHHMGYSQLIINEYMAWPAGGTSDDPVVDANGDGTAAFGEDEFIEFVNTGAEPLDISGWKIYDKVTSLTMRHEFPAETIIAPGAALLVFGGGTPAGSFGNTSVQVASTMTSAGLGMTNTADTILVMNASDEIMIELIYGDQIRGTSVTRNPDITGDYASHPTLETLNMSPGTKLDGSLFIIPQNTIVQLASGGATVKEGDGTFTIELSITAPDAAEATTVEVVLISGDAADINGYTTQTVTFPAGSSDPQSITVTITDDDDVEPTDTLYFELQNLAGGTNAELGATTIFEVILEDNDFASSTLVINEFMAWPAGQDSGAGGDPTVDSNGDGIAHFEDDEFIEFVNGGATDLDISGWKIYDENTGNDPLRHIFPAGTVINPGGALVVFGGGNPTGEFGGSPYMLASQANQGLGMTNDFDKIIIRNANDETVIELAYGQQKRGTSTTLNPDITGAQGPHPALGEVNISPGMKVDGSPFEVPTNTEVSFAAAGGGMNENAEHAFEIMLAITRPSATEATTAEVIITSTGYEEDITYTTQTVTFPAGSSDHQVVTVTAIDDDEIEGDELYLFSISSVSGGNNAKKGSLSTFELIVTDDDVPLLFNEIFAKPTGTSGDANGDGVVDAVQDEFIEVVNNSAEAVDMSGWEFHDAEQLRHTFDDGTVLAPGKAIVVFGGGIPVGSFGGSEIQLSSTQSLDLDDAGDTLTIYGPDHAIVARTIYGALANDGQSITRSPDISGGFVRHSTADGSGGGLFSPGSFISSVLSTSSSLQTIRVYPNPAVKELKINQTQVENMTFTIFNLSGARILTLKHLNAISSVDISAYKRGLYLYELRDDEGVLVERGKLLFGE